MAVTGGPRTRRPRRRATALVTAVLVLVIGGVIGAVLVRWAAGGGTGDPTPSAGEVPAPPGVPVQDGPTYPVVKVVDGDTVHVQIDGQDETIRIIGINTPETNECWGSEASRAAAGLLDGATVALIADPTQSDRDRYGRLLRYVVLPDGTDFGLRMISDGNADEYTYDNAYAHQQAYRDADAAAAASGQGLWNAATCDGNPAGTGPEESSAGSAARQSVPASPAASETGPDGCDIKGNISGNGKIYHLPGSPDYDRTRIDESKGERWFCSVAEAEAAGWRARN